MKAIFRPLIAALIILAWIVPGHTKTCTIVVGGLPVASGGACADADTYTALEANENFEGTGYDNGDWTTWTGTPNADDTTATVLRGSQQLALDNGERVYKAVSGSPSGGSIHFRYKAADGTPSANHQFLKIGYGGDSDTFVINLYHRTDGNIGAYHGSSYGTTTDTPLATNNTMVHVWLAFTLGTGADGQLGLYISSNGTKPGSPTIYLSNGTATSANSYDRISLWNSGEATSQITYYDQFLFDTSTSIGDVCND